MNKFTVPLILLTCLLVGFVTGRLTKDWHMDTENYYDITNSVSFDETFNGLDYTNYHLSSAEKYEIMDAKSDMMRAHNLYIINQVIQTANEENRSLWRSEKSLWEQLSNDIIQFIEAKMTKQWETGKTGTAGASFCAKCRYDLETVRGILLETIVTGPEFMIKDNCIMSNLSYSSKQISLDDTTLDLINGTSQYLDAYISAVFGEWRNEATSLSQWRNSTYNLIISLKNHLNEYVEILNCALDSACPNHTNILNKWVFQQISQIIKKGD